MNPVHVLYVGDAEIILNRYQMGVDVMEQSYLNDMGHWFVDAVTNDPGMSVRHVIPHYIPSEFPDTLEALQQYQVVVLSDVGYNSMVFYPGFMPPFSASLGLDRVELLKQYVEAGGGLLMVGGYFSFAGFNGAARWGGTPAETVLPVTISRYDDRVEMTQGFRFEVTQPDHPIVANLPWDQAEWELYGYNRVTAKPGATVLATYQGDPLIACWAYGKGRTAAFTTDFAPHWAGSFVQWTHYSTFWRQMVEWLAQKKATAEATASES